MRSRSPALWLVALSALSGCAWFDATPGDGGASGGRTICSEATLPGHWRSTLTGNVWIFEPDGRLACDGPCRFTGVTGAPVGWAFDPSASLYARPISHVKLSFAKGTFQGVFGAFRCWIEDGGRRLVLEPEEDTPMVFERQQWQADRP